MTENQLLATLCKCGGEHKRFRNRFHKLTPEQRRKCLALVQSGKSWNRAIQLSKMEVSANV